MIMIFAPVAFIVGFFLSIIICTGINYFYTRNRFKRNIIAKVCDLEQMQTLYENQGKSNSPDQSIEQTNEKLSDARPKHSE